MINGDELNTEEDVTNLLSKISMVKSSLVDNVIRQHGKFENLEMEIDEIASNFDEVHKESENIINKSSKVSEALFLSLEDKEKYQRQIDSLKTMKQIVVDLIILNKHIHKLQIYSEEDITLSIECLDKISVELEAVNEKLKYSSAIRMQELKAYNILLINLANIKGDLTSKVEYLWENNVIINKYAINPCYDYSHTSSYHEFVPDCKSVEITIPKPILKCLIGLMCNLDIGHLKIGLLMRFITSEIIYKTIQNCPQFKLVTTIKNDKFTICSAAVINDESLSENILISSLIKDLIDTLTCLKDYLLSITLPGRKGSILEVFQTELFDIVLTDCLASAFFSEIVLDASIISELQSLINFFHEFHFISESNNRLTDFINNSDYRTRNNDVTDLLNDARTQFSQSILECTDAHDPFLQQMDLENFLIQEDNEDELLPLISQDVFLFPKCKVSSSVLSLVTSVAQTVELYGSNNPKNHVEIVDFLQTLPEIITMYLYVVPLTNKDAMGKLPLACVLHYNNCMYLAHYCLYWTTQIKPLITKLLSESNENEIIYKMAPCNLLSLVYQFRDEAVKCVTRECNQQKCTISEFFYNLTSFRGVGNENREQINKIVKRCIYHLSSLYNIYDGFPITIFDNVYGCLIEWTVLKIVDNIINMTDIVQVDNEQLILLIREFNDQIVDHIIMKRLTTLNVDCSKEAISTYLLTNCNQWGKLQQILFILENGLKSIEERWLTNGKAMCKDISATEVRSLIKALFKNSTMRSKVMEVIV